MVSLLRNCVGFSISAFVLFLSSCISLIPPLVTITSPCFSTILILYGVYSCICFINFSSLFSSAWGCSPRFIISSAFFLSVSVFSVIVKLFFGFIGSPPIPFFVS